MSLRLEEIEVLLERIVLTRIDSLEEKLSTVVSDLTSIAASIDAGVATLVQVFDSKLSEVEALLKSNTDFIDPAAVQPAVTELRSVLDAITAATTAVQADTTGDTPAPTPDPVVPAPDAPPADSTTV